MTARTPNHRTRRGFIAVCALATLATASDANAQRALPFAFPVADFVSGVHAGADELIVADTLSAWVIARSGEARRVTGLGPIAGVAGASTDAGPVYALLERNGGVARQRSGTWERTTLERSGSRVAMVGVAVGLDASVYCASESDGLFIWHADGSVERIAYPEATMRATAVTLGEGTAYVVGQAGMLLALRGASLQRLGIPLPTDPYEHHPSDLASAWWSEGSHTLWVGTVMSGLFHVDPTGRTARRVPLNVFGSIRALRGYTVAHRDVVLLGAQSTLVAVVAGREQTLPAACTFPRAITIDPASETFVAGCQNGVVRGALPGVSARAAGTAPLGGTA
ncbi:MAG: hypothetical protein WCJ30_04185 [Deltaproteobacteria bacterium]